MSFEESEFRSVGEATDGDEPMEALRSPEELMVQKEEFAFPAEKVEGVDAERLVSEGQIEEQIRPGDDTQRIAVQDDQPQDPELS